MALAKAWSSWAAGVWDKELGPPTLVAGCRGAWAPALPPTMPLPLPLLPALARSLPLPLPLATPLPLAQARFLPRPSPLSTPLPLPLPLHTRHL